jgi:hypothetical protein
MHHTSSSVTSYLNDRSDEGCSNMRRGHSNMRRGHSNMRRGHSNMRRGHSDGAHTVGRHFPCWASAQGADLDDRRESNMALFLGKSGMPACQCRGKAGIWNENVSAIAPRGQHRDAPEMQHVSRHVALNLRENTNSGNAQTTIIWGGEFFAAEMKWKARIANKTDDVSDLRQMQRQRAGGRRCCHAHAARQNKMQLSQMHAQPAAHKQSPIFFNRADSASDRHHPHFKFAEAMRGGRGEGALALLRQQMNRLTTLRWNGISVAEQGSSWLRLSQEGVSQGAPRSNFVHNAVDDFYSVSKYGFFYFSRSPEPHKGPSIKNNQGHFS